MQYALIKNGKVERVIIAEQDFITSIQSEFDHIEAIDTLYEQGLGVGVGWDWDGTSFSYTPDANQVILGEALTPQPRHITQLAFLNRFTDAEAIAIDLASQGSTVQAAAMRRYQAKVNAATYIDLDRQDTRDGVIALEALGLLGTGRALVILDDPILPEEKSSK
jgi:hypothetical protein